MTDERFDKEMVAFHASGIARQAENGTLMARLPLTEGDLGVISGVLHASGCHMLARIVQCAEHDLSQRRLARALEQGAGVGEKVR